MAQGNNRLEPFYLMFEKKSTKHGRLKWLPLSAYNGSQGSPLIYDDCPLFFCDVLPILFF